MLEGHEKSTIDESIFPISHSGEPENTTLRPLSQFCKAITSGLSVTTGSQDPHDPMETLTTQTGNNATGRETG